MPTTNSSNKVLEEENTEKVTTSPSSLEQILGDIKMSLWKTISEADLKSPKVRALIATIFPEIEQVLNACKRSLAENAIKIEGEVIKTDEWFKRIGWLENTFEVNTTTFPWKILLFNKNEEWFGFVNKLWERAFDSVLSLWDNFLATKTNWKVVLENVKTWVYIEWTEEANTLIDRKKYKSKIKQIEKNKGKLEYISRWNYHNLITVLSSLDIKQKIKLFNEIDEASGELVIDELVKFVSRKLGISEDAADQMIYWEDVIHELYIKNEEEIDKRLSNTRYSEFQIEILKNILSDSSNWILESLVSHFFPEIKINKVLVIADKWYIEVTTEKWIQHIDFDQINLVNK